MTGRLLVGDTAPTAQVAMVPFQVDPLMLVSCRCCRRATRGRARSSRMSSWQVEGSTRLDDWYSTTAGGRHSLARSRPPPVGRQWTPTGSRQHASVTHFA
ncbi:hypothetical protein EVAR_20395_1 [Eumeta japonica]|uniref:Uncharacterized protein n=1 Tax=Eumeta variegata TaxID=151549 RepID=A0A4C1TXU0_EUMVA|nr:hypothetical protein EVAR_20395_1 [Eumeta japonica]